jgi:hypothetical protein
MDVFLGHTSGGEPALESPAHAATVQLMHASYSRERLHLILHDEAAHPVFDDFGD